MSVKSLICLTEMMKNKGKKFGADPEYYPAFVEKSKGKYVPALFTEEQIQVAIDRAAKNKDDIQDDARKKKIWESLFG